MLLIIKKGKSAGRNGFFMESLVYGGHRLLIHFSLLFTYFARHCYLPSAFMECEFIPLVKDNGSDITLVSNITGLLLSQMLKPSFLNLLCCTKCECIMILTSSSMDSKRPLYWLVYTLLNLPLNIMLIVVAMCLLLLFTLLKRLIALITGYFGFVDCVYSRPTSL